jgi:hypothetical protein
MSVGAEDSSNPTHRAGSPPRARIPPPPVGCCRLVRRTVDKRQGTAVIRYGITLEARIVHLCDVFDALTSDRTYRPAFTVTEALRMIVADTGSAFDPDVVDALTTVIPEWERLCAA